jgi:hypothetical protein
LFDCCESESYWFHYSNRLFKSLKGNDIAHSADIPVKPKKVDGSVGESSKTDCPSLLLKRSNKVIYLPAANPLKIGLYAGYSFRVFPGEIRYSKTDEIDKNVWNLLSENGVKDLFEKVSLLNRENTEGGVRFDLT